MTGFGVIMAGGEGTRMAIAPARTCNKALQAFGQAYLISPSIALMRQVCTRFAISANQDLDKLQQLAPDALLLADLPSWQKQGPLAGIASCVAQLQSQNLDYESLVVVPCDMPFLTVDVMQALQQHLGQHPAVYAEFAGRAYPLVSVFSTTGAQQLLSYMGSTEHFGVYRCLRHIGAQAVPFVGAGYQKIFSNLNDQTALQQL